MPRIVTWQRSDWQPAHFLWVGFAMGEAVPILLFELFVRSNPVASFWLAREAESVHKETQKTDVQIIQQEFLDNEKLSVRE